MYHQEYYDRLIERVEFIYGKPYWILGNKNHKDKMAGRVSNTGYRQIGVTINKKTITLLSHRVNWYKKYKSLPEYLDHIDGDRDNSRLSNLRIATHSQNMRNRKGVGVSNFLGVSRRIYKNKIKWCANIKLNGKTKYIGSYDNEVDAAKAYNIEAFKVAGDYANLNIITELTSTETIYTR